MRSAYFLREATGWCGTCVPREQPLPGSIAARLAFNGVLAGRWSKSSGGPDPV